MYLHKLTKQTNTVVENELIMCLVFHQITTSVHAHSTVSYILKLEKL